MLIIISLFSYFTINKGFSKLENENANINCKRVQEAINKEFEILRSSSMDWAEWDDTYLFIQNKYPDYIASNLNDETLTNLNIEFMSFTNASGDIFYFINNTKLTEPEVKSIKEYLSNNYKKFETTNVTGLKVLENHFLIVSSQPILKSDKEGPSTGFLATGYKLDEKRIKELESLVWVEINMFSYEQSKNLEAKEALKYSSEYLEKNKTDIRTYFLIRDIEENPAVIVETTLPREIYKEGINTLNIFLILIWSTGLLFILTIIIFNRILSKNITRPLSKLVSITKEIGEGNFSKKIDMNAKGEIKELISSVELMADNLKIYQAKLVASEKKHSKKLEEEVNKKTSELNKKIKDINSTKTAILNIMEDMSKANEELKSLDKTKSEFLNIVSHELKTPLTALMAHLDVLEDMKDNLTKEELNSLEAIKRNSNNLKMLISNILEIARMDSGRFELARVRVDLEKLIKNVVDELQILANQKGLKIITKIEKLPAIEADDLRIKEILNNLITNAIKFTEKGFITIKANKDKEVIKIQVTDTGVGIPQDKIKNLFQKFYQVDASISRRYGGTGLGLLITKKIIEAHGGTINVKSTEGKGTTFTFTLPIKSEIKKSDSRINKKDIPDPFAKVDSQIKEFIKQKEKKR